MIVVAGIKAAALFTPRLNYSFSIRKQFAGTRFLGRCDSSSDLLPQQQTASTTTMANSRFQYVKKFELPDALLPDTFLIARLDGHRFTKFTAEHGFTKPNDERGLLLMAECARQVMSEWSDLVMAFGQSDEFSFLLPASSALYGRRSAKLSTSFVSLFSSSFVFFWPKHFPDTPLLYPPNFDARIVSYPSAEHVRDYFAWRQADCHINNLYNSCFWALVADGMSKQDAQVALKGTTSGDKNELLFSRFGTNYNEIPERFRKGTTLFRSRPSAVALHPSEPFQRPLQDDPAAKKGMGKTDEGAPLLSAFPASGSGEEISSRQRTKSMDGEAPNPVESKQGEQAGSTVDVNLESGSKGRNAQAGLGLVPSVARKEKGDQSLKMSGEGETEAVGKTGDTVVRVVSGADGKVKSKRLVKKGHAPPGAIEEVACDLIRDDFWDRNPHILAGVARRR